MHYCSDKALRRPGYVYSKDGFGYHVSTQPYINWDHIDGPLLFMSDGQLHWLTLWERFQLWAGYKDIHDIDFKIRTNTSKKRIAKSR